MVFLIFVQFMRHPLIKLFHLSNLLPMLNDHRMVDVEFLSNFSCSCKRSNFDGPLSWSLSTSDGHPVFLIFKGPLQNFLNHHCIVCSLAVPRPNVLLMLQVVSATL